MHTDITDESNFKKSGTRQPKNFNTSNYLSSITETIKILERKICFSYNC